MKIYCDSDSFIMLINTGSAMNLTNQSIYCLKLTRNLFVANEIKKLRKINYLRTMYMIEISLLKTLKVDEIHF